LLSSYYITNFKKEDIKLDFAVVVAAALEKRRANTTK
jgi:hypothetical protein